jgi:hypothetical protein
MYSNYRIKFEPNFPIHSTLSSCSKYSSSNKALDYHSLLNVVFRLELEFERIECFSDDALNVPQKINCQFFRDRYGLTFLTQKRPAGGETTDLL